jgi:hypothetical protein
MHEADTRQLEGSSALAGLAPQAAGLVSAPDCRSARRQRGRRQPVDEARPRMVGHKRSITARLAGHLGACRPGSWPRSLRLPRPAWDPRPDCRRDSTRLWRLVPPASRRPLVPSAPVESAKTRPPRPPARRDGDRPVARGDLAGPQKGAEAQQQTILLIDESGCYPLPSVVRTYAPVGHTPIVEEWCTRDHLSAISAISPEGM